MSFGAAQAPEWLTRSRLADLPPSLIVHARPKLSAGLQAGHFKLMQGLAQQASAAGLGVEVVTFSRDGQKLALAQGGHFHVCMDDMPGYGLNMVYCVPSYLNGFWFFDEIGTRNNSETRLADFDAGTIPWAEAKRVFSDLQAKFIAQNRSRFSQNPLGRPLENGALCLFAQGFHDQPYHRHYFSAPDFIRAAIAAKGERHLYIKPHPIQKLEELEEIMSFHDPENRVEVTDASIHDLLPIAHCVLTLTSAVGFEAFLHRKPVVLGGQTDFWHNAITVTNAKALPAAIDAACATDWPYKKYLTWYLKRRCLEDRAEDLPRLLQRLYRKGWLWADQGAGRF